MIGEYILHLPGRGFFARVIPGNLNLDSEHGGYLNYLMLQHRVVPKGSSRGGAARRHYGIRPLVVTLYIGWFKCFAGLALVT
jgi:hypothetical protein